MAEGSTIGTNSSFTGSFSTSEPSFSSLQQKERIKFWNQKELEKLEKEQAGQTAQQSENDKQDIRLTVTGQDLASVLSQAKSGLKPTAITKRQFTPPSYVGGSSKVPISAAPSTAPQPPPSIAPSQPITNIPQHPAMMNGPETKEAEEGESSMLPTAPQAQQPQEKELYTTPVPHEDDNGSTWMNQAHQDHFRSRYHYPQDEEKKDSSVTGDESTVGSQFSWLLPGYSFRDQAPKPGAQLFYKMKPRDPPTGSSSSSSSQAPWNIDPLATLQAGKKKNGRNKKKSKTATTIPLSSSSQAAYPFGSWVPSPYLDKSYMTNREPARMQTRKPLGEDDTERWVLSKEELAYQRREREDKERLERELQEHRAQRQQQHQRRLIQQKQQQTQQWQQQQQQLILQRQQQQQLQQPQQWKQTQQQQYPQEEVIEEEIIVVEEEFVDEEIVEEECEVSTFPDEDISEMEYSTQQIQATFPHQQQVVMTPRQLPWNQTAQFEAQPSRTPAPSRPQPAGASQHSRPMSSDSRQVSSSSRNSQNIFNSNTKQYAREEKRGNSRNMVRSKASAARLAFQSGSDAERFGSSRSNSSSDDSSAYYDRKKSWDGYPSNGSDKEEEASNRRRGTRPSKPIDPAYDVKKRLTKQGYLQQQSPVENSIEDDSSASSSLPSLPRSEDSDASSESSDVFADEFPDYHDSSSGSSLDTEAQRQMRKNEKYEDTLNAGWTPSSRCIGILVLLNCGMMAWGIWGIIWLVNRNKSTTTVAAPTSAPEGAAEAAASLAAAHHNIFDRSAN